MHELDHVALVVRQLEPVLERCVSAGLDAGPIEDFPGEGTREVYLGSHGRPARLLLMQPSSESGPYARALAKRGPGLHHVAIHVPQLSDFLKSAQGWLVHPFSLDSESDRRTVWLARPGVGALLEVHESESDYSGPRVVERVEVAHETGLEKLLELVVGTHKREFEGVLTGMGPNSTGPQSRLQLGNRWFAIDELAKT